MTLLAVLQEHGLTAEVIEGGNLYVSPKERLTDGLRTWIREHKPDLIVMLRISEACRGFQITPDQFYALTTPADRADIRTGRTPVEHLRWYAGSLAEGIQSGRIVFHPTGALTRHGVRG